VRLGDDIGDLDPIDGHVQVDAHPTAVAHVGRPEIVLRIRADQRLLSLDSPISYGDGGGVVNEGVH
jgi:hypothetical protein